LSEPIGQTTYARRRARPFEWIGGFRIGEIMTCQEPEQKPEDSQELEQPEWLYQDETWLDLLRDTFQQYDGQAERAMRLFHRLIDELEKGSKSTVITSLESARRLAFCCTQFHHECWRFYRHSLDLPEAEGNALLECFTEEMRAAQKSKEDQATMPQ
jgi:hypothetical protein